MLVFESFPEVEQSYNWLLKPVMINLNPQLQTTTSIPIFSFFLKRAEELETFLLRGTGASPLHQGRILLCPQTHHVTFQVSRWCWLLSSWWFEVQKVSNKNLDLYGKVLISLWLTHELLTDHAVTCSPLSLWGQGHFIWFNWSSLKVIPLINLRQLSKWQV